MKLYIGNKNYSSWSLRAWILLRQFGLKFDEVQLELFSEHFYSTLEDAGANGKVPVIQDQQAGTVTDSLAIAEYVNEQYLNGQGWPENCADRARARSLCCEMHSGFMALRSELPMNIRRSAPAPVSEQALADIRRIDQIWSELRAGFRDHGPWLMGRYSVLDAFFAPVVSRFQTYGIALSPEAEAYRDHVLSSPAMQEWYNAALQETSVIEQDELPQ